MTVTNTLQRQPTKFDYASPTQFKFQIQKLPKVEYFTTACNIPGISLNATVQPTPLADIPLPGDTISFGDLEITFLVDENLENYREIHGWMYGIGFPKARTQFADLVAANKDRFYFDNKNKFIPCKEMAIDCLIRFEKRILKKEILSLREKIKTSNEENIISIIKELSEIEKDMNELKKKYK